MEIISTIRFKIKKYAVCNIFRVRRSRRCFIYARKRRQSSGIIQSGFTRIRWIRNVRNFLFKVFIYLFDFYFYFFR